MSDPHATQDRAARPYRLTTLNARLLDVAVPTSTRVWEALEPLECAYCEGHIGYGDLFTRALVPGFGRSHQNLCTGCRRFQVRHG